MHPLLNSAWTRPVGLLALVAMAAMITWAIRLLQSAADQEDFSLILAGCMVCSAAVGLAAVIMVTLTGIPL